MTIEALIRAKAIEQRMFELKEQLEVLDSIYEKSEVSLTVYGSDEWTKSKRAILSQDQIAIVKETLAQEATNELLALEKELENL